MALALTATAVAVLLGAALALVLGLRRRRRTAVLVAALTLLVAAGLETVPRAAGSRELRPACLDGPVRASVAGGSVTYQVLTGGLRVRAEIGAEQVQQLVAARLDSTRLADAEVTLAEGEIEVTSSLATPMGDLALTVRVSPAVADGHVTFAPVSAEVAGRTLPPRVLEQLAGAGRAPDAPGACAGGLGGGDLTVLSAEVHADGLALSARL